MCHGSLVGGEWPVCLACETAITPLHGPVSGDNEVLRRLPGTVPIQRAAAYMPYYAEHPAARLVLDGKYRGRRDLLCWLTQRLYNHLEPQGFMQGIDVIVPVPMHPFKQFRRGYNQSQVIALELSRLSGLPLAEALGTPWRRKQKSLHRTQRLNTRPYVVQHPRDVAGRHVLIVDDVITTGATVAACAQALLHSGARAVSVCALALDRLN